MIKQTILNSILKINGWLSVSEGNMLYEFAKSSVRIGEIVEIGSFEGRSTAFLTTALKENLNTRKVYAIDPHLGIRHKNVKRGVSTLDRFKKNMSSLGLSKQVHLIQNNSVAAEKGWQKPISLLFVDGMHEYEFVKKDLQIWLPHVINNGIVVCHDAFSREPDVFMAIKKEMLSGQEYKYFGVVDSSFIAIKGTASSFFESINLWRAKISISIALNILQNEKIPWKLRYFVVNRIMKILMLNKFVLNYLLRFKKTVLYSFLFLGSLFLFTRLYRLDLLPITNDEAVYIYWAKLIATTNRQWFITLTAGKPPLVHWLMVFFLKILPENMYLIAGRMPSVLAGAICLLGTYKLSLLLFQSKKLAVISAFLIIISPFILFYDRMAFFDSFLSAMLVGTIYYAVKAGETLDFSDTLTWGIFLGLAFLSKPTAILFLVLSPIVFLLSVSIHKVSASWKVRIKIAATALLISQLIHNSLIVSRGYWDYLPRSLDYRPSASSGLAVYINLFGKNFIDSVSWLSAYFTLPLFLFSALSVVFLLKKNLRRGLILMSLFFIPIALFCFFGKIYFPRYILFTIPYLVISCAYFFNYILEKNKLLFLFTFLVFTYLPIRFDLLLLHDPTNVPLPKIENWQYITGYPSSYGFDPIYSYLDQQLKKPGKVTLLVQGGLSHFPDAFRLRYWNEKRISIFEKQKIDKIDPYYFAAKENSKVFIVFRDNGVNYQFSQHANLLPVNVVAIGKKPGGRDPIYLTELK